MPNNFLNSLGMIANPVERWLTLAHDPEFLESDFSIQYECFLEIYKNWDHSKFPPPPAWVPSEDEIARTNLHKFIAELGLKNYQDLRAWSIENRESFWARVIDKLSIQFAVKPQRVTDPHSKAHSPDWLPGAKFNIAASCFGAGDQAPAIIYQSESGISSTTTYGDLKRDAMVVARSLQKIGLSKGDAVAIDMPMNVESVAIYLGVVLAGCAVVSIADSFAPTEIATRMRISKAKLIFTQDQILRSGKFLPLFAKVKEAGDTPAIVLPVEPGTALKESLRVQDKSWDDFLLRDENPDFHPVLCEPDTIINILFSSGTTGDPKAIPWTHVTPIKCASDGFFHHDIRPGNIVAWPTNLGWMMGPWLLFATLLNKGTIALYGGTPLGRDFGLFIQNKGVQILGLVPSIVKAWRNSKCMEKLDWGRIKLFSSTGECSNFEDYLYLMSLAHYRPVIEYCGGTEIGGGFLTGTLLQPASPATFSTTALGVDVKIMQDGELYVVPPSIGLSNSLLNKSHEEVYFSGTPTLQDGTKLRRHGDQMEALPQGYFRALGRADDTMNLGGIKVSSAEIERSLVSVEGVSETAAVAENPPGGGPSLLKIFYVLKPGFSLDESHVLTQFQKSISTQLNPLFKVNKVQRIDSLPRTASNKVMRRLLR
jgi:acetyl-CoA synthetase